MPNRFCAICGQAVDDTAPHFGMCLKCYLLEHPLFELLPKLSLKICIDCGSYSKKEEWIIPNENEENSIISEAIFRYLLRPSKNQKNIVFNLEIDESSCKYSSNDLIRSAEVNISGALKSNKTITHKQTISINIGHELCKNCTNLRGGTYFLAIIQLRVKDDTFFDFLNLVIDDLNNYVEKLLNTLTVGIK